MPNKLCFSPTYVDSAMALNKSEQAALQSTVRVLKQNIFDPRLRTHRVKNAKQEGLLSARVTRDIRVIFRAPGSMEAFLLYVDHHDEAYLWAERTRIEFSESRVTIVQDNPEEIEAIQAEELPVDGPFSHWSDDDLRAAKVPKVAFTYVRTIASAKDLESSRDELGDFLVEHLLVLLGMPTSKATEDDEDSKDSGPRWEGLESELLANALPKTLDEGVRGQLLGCQDVDSLFEQFELLSIPTEIQESVVTSLCHGDNETDIMLANAVAKGIETPFEDFGELEDLGEALQYRQRIFSTWELALTKQQRALVEARYEKPVRVSGLPGTGKTVLALHRAGWLTKYHTLKAFRQNDDAYVLILVFNRPLAQAIEQQVKKLLAKTNRWGRIRVSTLHSFANGLLGTAFNFTEIDRAKNGAWEAWHTDAPEGLLKLGRSYIEDEISKLIKGFGVASLDDYLVFERRGRRYKMEAAQRREIWRYYELYQELLAKHHTHDFDDSVNMALAYINETSAPAEIAGVVVDEAQDFSAQALRLVAALAGSGVNRLFLTGDACQSIYQPEFSLADVGIDVSGTARRLKYNYRNAKAIWADAIKVLGADKYTDWIGVDEAATEKIGRGYLGKVELRGLRDWSGEHDFLHKSISEELEAVSEKRIAVLAHSNRRLHAAKVELQKMGIEIAETPDKRGVYFSTMHSAKGLEFETVYIIGLDDRYMPYLDIAPGELAERERFIEQQRRLLFTSMTRARDNLILTWCTKPSRFLSEFRPSDGSM